jgi:hypothetical protein
MENWKEGGEGNGVQWKTREPNFFECGDEPYARYIRQPSSLHAC